MQGKYKWGDLDTGSNPSYTFRVVLVVKGASKEATEQHLVARLDAWHSEQEPGEEYPLPDGSLLFWKVE